jgi:hypothetical protein
MTLAWPKLSLAAISSKQNNKKIFLMIIYVIV